jgi:hypothetical protein
MQTPGGTMNTLITNNVHRWLKEPPVTASAALGRLEPLQPLRDALSALGLDQRVSVRPTDLPGAECGDQLSFSLTWLLADGSPAQVAWTLSVSPAGDGDSLLSATIRARSDSAASDRQLLAAWPLLGRIVESHTTRLFNTVSKLSEQLEENSLEPARAPLAAAA